MHFPYAISPSSAIASGALPKKCVVRTSSSTLIHCLRLVLVLDLLCTLAFKVAIEGCRLKKPGLGDCTPSIHAENLTVLTRLLDLAICAMVCCFIYSRFYKCQAYSVRDLAQSLVYPAD